ncbi:MAG TPA: glycosyltransferase [Oligoflexia bacterium]|nr:glycosyltransferase [Oligoflexia bacterium]HMP49882.1 glycosyltransferase [Oligoflexia bacterium]
MSEKANTRVLFITPQPFLANRGSPLRVKSEIEALLTLGYEVDVLCFPFGTEWNRESCGGNGRKNGGVKLLRSWKVPGISEPAVGPSWQKIIMDIPLTMKALVLGLSGTNYDVIHGVEEAAFIAQVIGFIRKTPFVSDLHSLLPDQLRYSGFLSNKYLISGAYKAYNQCLKNSSGIVAVCKEVQDYASLVAPHVPCAQLEDLPLDSSWESSRENENKLRKNYSLEGKTILAYTGNFSSYQGIQLLLESYALALRNLPNSKDQRLLLVGESNPELLQLEQRRANELGISENVIFTGELPSSMMGSVMSIADALVSPRSKGGNTPLKVYCYMASGKPLVATAISSHTQALDDKSAFLAAPDPASFAQAIIKALETNHAARELQRQKGECARYLLESRFNKKLFTQAMGWLYERVTQAPLPEENWEQNFACKIAS